MAITDAMREQVLQLYTAYFNRVADKDGVDYWLSEMDTNGWSVSDVARSFAVQSEYTDIYDGLEYSEIVSKVYTNVLNRTPTTEDLAYWAIQLNDGSVTIANFIQAIVYAATEVDDDGNAVHEDDKTLFDNKTSVSEYAYENDINHTDISLADITTDTATVAAKQEAILFVDNTDKYNPMVIALSGGGFVITWYNNYDNKDNPVEEIMKAQVYRADGTPLGDVIEIDADVDSIEWQPTIESLSTGGFVISWRGLDDDSNDYVIFAQIYDEDGSTVGEKFIVNVDDNTDGSNSDDTSSDIVANVYEDEGIFEVNSESYRFQNDAKVTVLNSGEFVVTWESYDTNGDKITDNDDSHIAAQIFDANGNKICDEFQVNRSITNEQTNPSITTLLNGGFVITWTSDSTSGNDTDETHIAAQIYDKNANKIGEEFEVNTTVTDNQYGSQVVGLNSGGFVVTWIDRITDDSSNTTYSLSAQIYDNTGAKIGAQNTVIDTLYIEDYRDYSLTALDSGGFAIVAHTDDISSVDINLYNAYGQQYASTITISDSSYDSISSAKITTLESGNIVVAMLADDGDNEYPYLFVKMYESDGTLVSSSVKELSFDDYNPYLSATDNYTPLSLTSLDNGGFMITWHGYEEDSTNQNIVALQFDENSKQIGDIYNLLEYIEADPTSTLIDFDLAHLSEDKFILTYAGYDIITNATDTSYNHISAQIYDANADESNDALDTNIYCTEVNQPKIGDDTDIYVRSGIISVDDGSADYVYEPVITKLEDGNFVISWLNNSNNQYNIVSQIFDSTGEAIGDEIVIESDYNVVDISVKSVSSTKFVVTWLEDLAANEFDIKGQVYTTDGDIVNDQFTINPDDTEIDITNESYQGYYSIDTINDGGFVATWLSTDNTIVLAQQYTATGDTVGSQFTINTGVDGQELFTDPTVTTLSNDNYLVTWLDSDNSILSGQIISSSGTNVSVEFEITDQARVNENFYQDITTLDDGGFIITYSTTSDTSIAQRYDSTGTTVGDPITLSFADGGAENAYASVEALENGDIAFTWLNSDNLIGNEDFEILGQIYDSSYEPMSGVFKVDESNYSNFANDELKGYYIGGIGDAPYITALDDGDFVVAWVDGTNTSVLAQIYSAETLA
jgi:hypothetical protein